MQGTKPLIGFIGQGWIGKHYADEFEKRGFSTVRYALEEPYRANKDRVRDCDIVFIAVPTPTTPEKGFDASIVDSAVALVGEGKIAVIKSTLVPGMASAIQRAHPAQIVIFSPEFLSESTAAYDVANPYFNIVGMTEENDRQRAAAALVHSVLPAAPASITCKSVEAEIIKYTHNASAYTQIMFFNMMYDLATSLGGDWGVVHRAVLADPLIPNRYAQPIHKSGRGAGGHCFIKDYAALREFYEKALPGDPEGIAIMRANEQKNIDLLLKSGKDLDLLAGVYGEEVLAGASTAPRAVERVPKTILKLLVCAQSVDETDPILGFFRAWIEELARRAVNLDFIHLQGASTGLPSNVRTFSLGKDGMSGPRFVKRLRYTFSFWRYAWRARHEYDTVLVYINTEYVILGGLLWQLLGKKVALVVNATEVQWKVRFAARFADVIFYTDPRAYAARFPQAQHIPAGIEADAYALAARDAKPDTVLFVGRMARAKKLNAIIDAVALSARDTPSVHLDIYGVPMIADDRAYADELHARYQSLADAGTISFRESVPHKETPRIYASHEIFVHAGSASGFNKALFEAMAAGCLVVTVDPALCDVVRPELFVVSTDPTMLARAIRAALTLSPEERERERATLRAYVEREHALSVIIPNMFEAIYPRTASARSIGI